MELCKEITLSKNEHIWSRHEQFRVMNCIHFLWCAICTSAACTAYDFLCGFHFLISSVLWIFLGLWDYLLSPLPSLGQMQRIYIMSNLKTICIMLNVQNQDFGCKKQIINVIHLHISYSCPELLEIFLYLNWNFNTVECQLRNWTCYREQHMEHIQLLTVSLHPQC